MELFTVELTVANNCGVLNRITGLYAKCKHNIERLTVQESRDLTLSVIQIATRGDAAVQSQMMRQLSKLFDVKNVVLLNNSTL